jgi:23S rRNA (adenine-N6)-dimethyltransferase
VVANLPFHVTAVVLRRLFDDPSGGLQRAHLVVQWQVARARDRYGIGPPTDLLGATWGPWWDLRRGRRLPAHVFRPRPSVDAAVLVVTRKAKPLLPVSDAPRYRSFVRRAFARGRIERLATDLAGRDRARDVLLALRISTRADACDLSVDQWVGLFRELRASRPRRQASAPTRARRKISAE